MKNTMLAEAKKAKYKASFIMQFLHFILVFGIGQTFSGIFVAMVWIPYLLPAITELYQNSAGLEIDIMSLTSNLPDPVLLVMLATTIFTTITAIFYCIKIEKRSILSMGLGKKNIVSHYLLGLAGGTLLFVLTMGVGILTKAISFDHINYNVRISVLFLYLAAFLIQGMSEEVLLRGYFMVSLTHVKSIPAAVFINSFSFALLHIFNPGITVMAFINLILFGIFASVFTLYFDNLWGICALHSAWNFVQGNIFGFQVSGLNTSVNSVFQFSIRENADLIHGGSFGIEGGLGMTLVYGAGIILLIILYRKKLNQQ